MLKIRQHNNKSRKQTLTELLMWFVCFHDETYELIEVLCNDDETVALFCS